MQKYITYAGIFIAGIMGASCLYAAEEGIIPSNSSRFSKKRQPRPSITFTISLRSDNKTVETGASTSADKIDKIACATLGIPWPQERGTKLRLLDFTQYKREDPAFETTALEPQQYGYIRAGGPFENTDLGTFNFPQTFPETFIDKIIEENTTSYEASRITVHFCLSEESRKAYLEHQNQSITTVQEDQTSRTISMTPTPPLDQNSFLGRKLAISCTLIGLIGIAAWYYFAHIR